MALNLRIVSSSLWNNVTSLYKISGREPQMPSGASTYIQKSTDKQKVFADHRCYWSARWGRKMKNHPSERLKQDLIFDKGEEQLLQWGFHIESSGFVKCNRNQYKNLTCWKPLTVAKVFISLKQGTKALQFHVLPFQWLFWIKLQNNDILKNVVLESIPLAINGLQTHVENVYWGYTAISDFQDIPHMILVVLPS